MPNRTSDDIVNELLGLAGQPADGDSQTDDEAKNKLKLKRAEEERLTAAAVSLLDECVREVNEEDGKNKLADQPPVNTLRTFEHDVFRLAQGDSSKLKTIYTMADIQQMNISKAAMCIPAI